MENSFNTLYEILSSKSMEEVADAFYDCFGDSWAAEEYDYCLRVMGADGMEEDEYDEWGEYDGLESLEAVYEYMSLDEVMQHLSSDERDSMLEYYGYDDYSEDEEEDEEEEYEDEEIYDDDVVSIYVDGESIGEAVEQNDDGVREIVVYFKKKEGKYGYGDSVHLTEDELSDTYFWGKKDYDGVSYKDKLKGMSEGGANAFADYIKTLLENRGEVTDMNQLQAQYNDEVEDEDRADYPFEEWLDDTLDYYIEAIKPESYI